MPGLQRIPIAVLLSLCWACGAEGGPRGGAGALTWIGPATEGDGGLEGGTGPEGNGGGEDDPASDGTDEGRGDDPNGDGSHGSKFDLGADPPGEPPPHGEPGCHKIDFLFVIDDSESMYDDQLNLVANFPAFVSGIEAAIEEVEDIHVGVVTTDPFGYGPNGAGCKAQGALVNRTGGQDSSNASCGPYASGKNYMTRDDDLAESFACAAQVGTGGWNAETPMNVLEIVARGDLAGPGQCNEGFIRDDALLVAVIITDEWDGPFDPEFFTSSGTPQTWYDTIVAAKHFPENAAIVSLVSYEGGPCPPQYPEEDGHHIVELTEMFGDNGFVGGVCEPDYGPIFEQAVEVIDDACKTFLPPAG